MALKPRTAETYFQSPSSIHPQPPQAVPTGLEFRFTAHFPMSTETSLNETSPQATLATQSLLQPDLTLTPDTTLSPVPAQPRPGEA